MVLEPRAQDDLPLAAHNADCVFEVCSRQRSNMAGNNGAGSIHDYGVREVDETVALHSGSVLIVDEHRDRPFGQPLARWIVFLGGPIAARNADDIDIGRQVVGGPVTQ